MTATIRGGFGGRRCAQNLCADNPVRAADLASRAATRYALAAPGVRRKRPIRFVILLTVF